MIRKVLMAAFVSATSFVALAADPVAPVAGGTSATPGVCAGANAVATGEKKCELRRKLGSNKIERVCTTAAEREAARDAAQADLQRFGRCAGNEVACRPDL